MAGTDVTNWCSRCWALEQENAEFRARAEKAEVALEHERLRLAACGVAALGYADDPGTAGSASFEDVMRLVKRTEKAEAERDALFEALTPSAETKAEYIGEFYFKIDSVDEGGEECLRKVTVPWTTTKDIMKAISARAGVAPHPRDTSGVASHSPWESSHKSCVGRWPDDQADAAAREEEECEQPQPGGEE